MRWSMVGRECRFFNLGRQVRSFKLIADHPGERVLLDNHSVAFSATEIAVHGNCARYFHRGDEPVPALRDSLYVARRRRIVAEHLPQSMDVVREAPFLDEDIRPDLS